MLSRGRMVSMLMYTLSAKPKGPQFLYLQIRAALMKSSTGLIPVLPEPATPVAFFYGFSHRPGHRRVEHQPEDAARSAPQRSEEPATCP